LAETLVKLRLATACPVSTALWGVERGWVRLVVVFRHPVGS
jgi:hypothetical protein